MTKLSECLFGHCLHYSFLIRIPLFKKIHCPKDLKKWITSNHPSFYPKTEDEKMAVNVRFEDDTVWLTQEQLSLLFSKAKSTINEHIQNIFNEGELTESMCTLIFGNSEYQQKAPYN